MLLEGQQLNSAVFDPENIERASLRDGLSRGLVEAGEINDHVVVISADVSESVRVTDFIKKFPERYVEVGVSEQNMAGIASGLANFGKVPFMVAYAAFNPGRNWEQIRTTIALSDLPVKIVGTHVGVSVGPDGATHQALEDITLMRVIPNMQILVPCDREEAHKAILAASKNTKPTYIRITRHDTPVFTTKHTPFEQGKAEYFWRSEHPQVAIMGAGPLLYEALQVAKMFESEGIGTSVLNLHSIKPMDIEKVLEASRDAGAVVTVEEHQILGGLGGTVAEILAQNTPMPQEMVAVHDKFGQSGEAHELLEYYGLSTQGILNACRKVLSRK